MNNNYKNTNGRVNIKSPDTNALFHMYDKIPANQCVTFRNYTDGIWNETQLSSAFFSSAVPLAFFYISNAII